MNQIKPVATIQDLSTFGRCSLTVVIPTISALGVQCCPIPTAVFSTHTGGLGEVTKKDLTDFLAPTLSHYQKLGLSFSAIYTGYLSSKEQFDNCYAFFDSFPDAIHIVDPVMGDHGKAYKAYTPEMQQRMKELIRKAELITPNLTEVAILLGEDYPDQPLTACQVKDYLHALSGLTKGDIVITGIRLAGSTRIHNACFEQKTNRIFTVSVDPIDAAYPGTGDLFTSVLTGVLVQGNNLEIAVSKASSFTALAVATTHNAGTDSRYGVLLEQVLGALITDTTEITPVIQEL